MFYKEDKFTMSSESRIPQFLNILKSELGTDKVAIDSASLAIYSSDASIYSIRPIAVVTVESIENISKVIKVCISKNRIHKEYIP